MKRAKKYGDRELEQLNSLVDLLSRKFINVSDLERLMQPLPKARAWKELVKRLEWDEIQSLMANDNSIDAVAMVAIGEAWVAEDGRLEYTWKDADDGKKKGVRTVEMLFTTDIANGKLKPHPSLFLAAEMMLGLDALPQCETERERFNQRLKYWESKARQYYEPLKGSPRLKELIADLKDDSKGDTGMETYETAKTVFLNEERVAKLARWNDMAHIAATELAEQCAFIRSLFDGVSNDDETRFLALNAAVNAARFCDRLEEVAGKGSIARNRQRLRHKGRNFDKSTFLVGNACEACYRRNPERPPYPREVLDEMAGRTVYITSRVNIAPMEGSENGWEPMPVETFYAAKKAWAKIREVKMDDSTRTPKVGQLPRPTTTLNA